MRQRLWRFWKAIGRFIDIIRRSATLKTKDRWRGVRKCDYWRRSQVDANSSCRKRRKRIGDSVCSGSDRREPLVWLLLPDDQSCRRESNSIVEVTLVWTFHHRLQWMPAGMSSDYV